LAQHYGVEIASIDVETGRIDYFSPSENKSIGMRCALIYSGIHYDAASLAPMVDAPPEWHQTLFPIVRNISRMYHIHVYLIAQGLGEDDPIITALRRLADILRSKKAYTNTTTFKLKCEVSNHILFGINASYHLSAMQEGLEGGERSSCSRRTDRPCSFRRVLIRISL